MVSCQRRSGSQGYSSVGLGPLGWRCGGAVEHLRRATTSTSPPCRTWWAVSRPGLHRPAVQHRQRVRLPRRLPRSRALARDDAPRLVAAQEVLAETGRSGSASTHGSPTCELLMDRCTAKPLAQVVVSLNPRDASSAAASADQPRYLLVYARDARRCVLDATSPDAVDPQDFPLAVADGRRFRHLPLRNTNKVQPRHRTHAALHGLGRPGSGRVGDSLRQRRGDRAGLRRRPASRVAVEPPAHRRTGRRPGLPTRGGGWGWWTFPATGWHRDDVPGGRRRSSARSGSPPPRVGSTDTAVQGAQGPGRPRLQSHAEADRPGAADPRHHAGRCGRARLLRG